MPTAHCIEVKSSVWSDLKSDKEITGSVSRRLSVMKEEFFDNYLRNAYIHEINEPVVDASDLKSNLFFDFRKLLF